MIETETKGKQAFLDAMIEHVDPADYDGSHAFECLIGQTARKTLSAWQREQHQFNDCRALADFFQVDIQLVSDIYGRVAEDDLRHDYEASLAYARHVLTNGGA